MTETSQRSFLRPGKIFLLVILLLLAYAWALLVWVPAGWLWQQAAGYVSLPPQVRVQAVSGSLWDGAAGLRLQGRELRVDWRLGWPTLAAGIPLELAVETRSSRVDARIFADFNGQLSSNATGRVHVAEFEDLIRQSGGAMLEGDVIIDRLSLAWADNRLAEAQGHAYWPGGLVTWPMGNGYQSAGFPEMTIDLSEGSEGVSLTITQQGQPDPVAIADILRTGMLRIQVYKRLIDLAGQPWSGAASPGDVVFRVEQPLLPGGRF